MGQAHFTVASRIFDILQQMERKLGVMVAQSVQFKRAAGSRRGPQAGGGAALRQLFLGPAAALADLQVENVRFVINGGTIWLEEW